MPWKPGNWGTYFARKGHKVVTRSRPARGGGRVRPSAPGAISVSSVKLVLYRPIINFELNSNSGMVGRHLHRTGNRISQLAKLQVGKKTGRLAKSIKFEHISRTPLGPGIKVGGYTPYALLHHQGTRPHLIVPTRPGGSLVFRKGSRIVHTKIVRHPGTKPNRYLTDSVRKVLLR